MLLGRRAGLERQLDGSEHRLLVVMQHQRQDLHHLPVAAGALEQHRLQPAEAFGQLGERCAVAQRPGLALQTLR